MTSEQSIPSKAELLDALRASERELVTKLGAMPEEQFEEGRYENGWTARQILAHIASIEWSYPRLIEVALESPAAPGKEAEAQPQARPPMGEVASEPPTRTAQGGIDAYNQRHVDKRAEASVPELLAEFQKNRAATIAAVQSADEALLAAPIQSAGGVTGALANVIQAVAVLHVRAHVKDIVGEGR